MTLRLAPLVLALTLGACANLPSGSMNAVRFVSDPPGARVTTSFGATCTTPCTLQAPRADDFAAAFELPGHRTQTVQIQSVEPRVGGPVRGSFGGFDVRVGFADRSDVMDPTGRFRREHTPNPVSVRLERQ